MYMPNEYTPENIHCVIFNDLLHRARMNVIEIIVSICFGYTIDYCAFIIIF